MDPDLRKVLELLDRAEREWKPLPGPVALTAEYLRLIQRVEDLPSNRPGTEKGDVDRADLAWRDLLARIRRAWSSMATHSNALRELLPKDEGPTRDPV